MKASLSCTALVHQIDQQAQLSNPGMALTLSAPSKIPLLEVRASSYQGIKTGDDGYFRRCFWEFPAIKEGWRKYQSTVSDRRLFGGLEYILRWEDNGNGLARRQGISAWGRRGVAISQMSGLPASLYLGHPFDSNMSAIIPHDEQDLSSIFAFCSSDEYIDAVREIDQALKPTNSSLVRVPFDIDLWRRKYTDIDVTAHPTSMDPTQWAFDLSVSGAEAPLQVAVARLLGYSWPRQQADGLRDLIDDDGIACVFAVRGEKPIATRLQSLLATAYGDNWSTHKQAELLEAVGCKGWTLERWLNERFFKQHCELFQNRPFIWHIWDGLKKGGFAALINYHKLNRNLLETLTYNYLGDWIRRQHDDEKRGIDGASDRLIAAQALQEKLKLILKGEPPCDIFVRWKPIEEQPMGWEPDINDGVRINIRPFMMVGDVGKKGAGILRDKPNINWNKDRGSDHPDAPWYDLGLEYGGKKGDRINEHHLTLAEKQAARDAAGGGA